MRHGLMPSTGITATFGRSREGSDILFRRKPYTSGRSRCQYDVRRRIRGASSSFRDSRLRNFRLVRTYPLEYPAESGLKPSKRGLGLFFQLPPGLPGNTLPQALLPFDAFSFLFAVQLTV